MGLPGTGRKIRVVRDPEPVKIPEAEPVKEPVKEPVRV